MLLLHDQKLGEVLIPARELRLHQVLQALVIRCAVPEVDALETSLVAGGERANERRVFRTHALGRLSDRLNVEVGDEAEESLVFKEEPIDHHAQRLCISLNLPDVLIGELLRPLARLLNGLGG